MEQLTLLKTGINTCARIIAKEACLQPATSAEDRLAVTVSYLRPAALDDR